MPPYASTFTRAALPTLALLASASASAHAQAPSPDAAAAAPAPAPEVVPSAPDIVPAADAALPAVPASGRLVRLSGSQLTVSSGGAVLVRGRSTTVPVHVELRVGSTGRKVDESDTGAGHRFRLEGKATPGEKLRLIVSRTDGGTETSDTPVGQVRKLRATTASWYGPGLFGNRTACGQTLTPGLRGVAHKQLPCGTKLTVRFRGRITRATVIDRGPFHAGREFDLTQATAQAIGFRHVGRVWVSRR